MRITKEAKGKYQEMIRDYLDGIATDELVTKINTGAKTFGGCWNYIVSQARKEQQNNCACVRDDVVFGWAVKFFEDDSIKENEKKPEPCGCTTSDVKKTKKNEEKKDAPKADCPEFEQMGIDFSGLLDGNEAEGQDEDGEE